ncbi:Slx4p interacting protein [Loxospora ochrophaea]|nr:Slx4p interacting protein [Loxospora ochrophaea]
MSLIDKLSNLHLLLRVPSFSRWPLNVCFFSEDVYQAWQRWCERVSFNIRKGIKVSSKQTELPLWDEAFSSDHGLGKQNDDHSCQTELDGLDVGYSALKGYLEKSLFLLAESENTECIVCNETTGLSAATTLVCSAENCRATSHMTCLSAQFLVQEGARDSVIPVYGECPKCKTELHWVDLVKAMSLRIRGEREMAKLMKKPRVRRAKAAAGEDSYPCNFDGEIERKDSDQEVIEDETDFGNILGESVDDGWHYYGDEDDDLVSTTSVGSEVSLSTCPKNPLGFEDTGSRLEIVIEDSDWEGAAVID